MSSSRLKNMLRSRGALYGRLRLWLLLLAIFAYICLFSGRYVDDAYITFAYARTLGSSGVWGMHAGMPSNAATSPLNVLLLALPVRLGFSALASQLVLSALLVATIGLTLTRLSQELFAAEGWGYVATALLFANPLLISTSGLETYLMLALWLVGLCCFSAGAVRAAGRGRWAAHAGQAGRPAVCRRGRWDAVLAAPTRRVPLSPALRWNTAGVGADRMAHPGLGHPRYVLSQTARKSLGRCRFWQRPSAVLPRIPCGNDSIAGVVAGRTRSARPQAPTACLDELCVLIGGVAILHFIVYSRLQVPPFHWYYGMECCAAVLLGSAAMWAMAQEHVAIRPLVMTGLVAVAVTGAAVSATVCVRTSQMPVETNWTDTQQYREIAQWVNSHVHGRPFQLNGELGVIEYYSDSEGISNFSDREILHEAAAQHARGTPARSLMDANSKYLKQPAPVSVAGTLTTICPANRSYVKTWIVHSTWRQETHWCWIEAPDLLGQTQP